MSEVKICSICQKSKIVSSDREVSEFHWKTDTRVYSYCKECHRNYMKQHYKINKAAYVAKATRHNKEYREQAFRWLLEYYKTHPCVDCGETDPVVLEFDHRDPCEKETEVSVMVRRVLSLARIKREVAKCDVRCSNCHRRKTAREQNWFWIKECAHVE